MLIIQNNAYKVYKRFVRVRPTCSRVIWMDHGKVVADGPPEHIVERYLTGKSNA